MSIYVEGFELPNYNEKMFKGDPMGYICYLYVNSDGTADLEIKGKDYPVKNVPAPHGRLLDENDVCNYITNRIDKFDCDTERDHALMNVIADEITEDYHVPTAIEAENMYSENKNTDKE